MKMVRDLTLNEITELRLKFTKFVPRDNEDDNTQIEFDVVGYTRAAFDMARAPQRQYQD